MRSYGWARRLPGPRLAMTHDDPPLECTDPRGQDRLVLVRAAAGDLSAAEQQACDEHVQSCRCCQAYLTLVAPQVAAAFLRLVSGRKRRAKRDK